MLKQNNTMSLEFVEEIEIDILHTTTAKLKTFQDILQRPTELTVLAFMNL